MTNGEGKQMSNRLPYGFHDDDEPEVSKEDAEWLEATEAEEEANRRACQGCGVRGNWEKYRVCRDCLVRYGFLDQRGRDTGNCQRCKGPGPTEWIFLCYEHAGRMGLEIWPPPPPEFWPPPPPEVWPPPPPPTELSARHHHQNHPFRPAD